MQEQTKQMIDKVIDMNRYLVDKIKKSFDEGYYSGVIDSIAEMTTNVQELDNICNIYEFGHHDCIEYAYGENIQLHSEVVDKFEEKCK